MNTGQAHVLAGLLLRAQHKLDMPIVKVCEVYIDYIEVEELRLPETDYELVRSLESFVKWLG